jgi:hypothetical protein
LNATRLKANKQRNHLAQRKKRRSEAALEPTPTGGEELKFEATIEVQAFES